MTTPMSLNTVKPELLTNQFGQKEDAFNLRLWAIERLEQRKSATLKKNVIFLGITNVGNLKHLSKCPAFTLPSSKILGLACSIIDVLICKDYLYVG